MTRGAVVLASPGPRPGLGYLLLRVPGGWAIGETRSKGLKTFDLPDREAEALLALPKTDRAAALCSAYHRRRIGAKASPLPPGEGHVFAS